DGIHAGLIDVDADHRLAGLSEHRGGRQTDVAEADDSDRVEGDVRAHQGTPAEDGKRIEPEGSPGAHDSPLGTCWGTRANRFCHEHNRTEPPIRELDVSSSSAGHLLII